MNMLVYIPTVFGVSIEVYFILLVLGVLNFFIWRWLLKKNIKVERNRKFAIWTATILTTPLIYYGLIILWFFSMSYHPNYDFDKEKWLANKEKRYEFSQDIIDSKMLIGKTKSEVLQILGDKIDNEQNDNWSYDLGFKPGFANIDPDVLDIEFKKGKVVDVVQHEQ